VEHEDRGDRPGLDRDLHRRVGAPEPGVGDDQVAGAADREELGEALDHAEDDGVQGSDRLSARRQGVAQSTRPAATHSIPNAAATPSCVTWPASTFAAVPSSGSAAAAFAPIFASLRAYGAVALVSAKVDVRGTAPGMFATQ